VGALLVGLFVASPWALGLATPVSVATSLRAALRRGIVIFDETVFERLRAVDVVVFDKTGTLTTGTMAVTDVDAPAALVDATVALERHAAHPVARAIVAASADEDGAPAPDVAADGTDANDAATVEDFRSHDRGVEGVVDAARVLAGTVGLFDDREWSVASDIRDRAATARQAGHVPVVVGRDGAAEGLVVVGDERRTGWDRTLARLGDRGVDVVVLTGDHAEATGFLRDHPAVTQAVAGVPPSGKAAAVRRLGDGRRVAMVGDGTNDAPALAAADLGISLGSGTALAANAADVAILEDDLSAVETAFDLAGAARRRLRQNTALAFAYTVVTVPLALAGLLNPLFAVAGVVVAGGAIGVNATRPLR
jgi:P-type E1-E2 ATPase